MATKTTFDFNSKNINKGFQKFFDTIQVSQVKVSSNTGSTYFQIPLLFALIIGIIFPLTIVVAIVLIALSYINLSIFRQEKDNQEDTPKVLR